MSMMSRQRQLLLEGLQQAEGTVLWGKLRQVPRLDDEHAALAATLKEGGRSRSRKPRN